MVLREQKGHVRDQVLFHPRDAEIGTAKGQMWIENMWAPIALHSSHADARVHTERMHI